MNPPDFTCDEARDRLVALEEGELGPSEVELMERHLAECPQCNRVSADVSALRPTPPRLVNPALEAALFARLDRALDDAWDRPPRAAAPIAAVRWRRPTAAATLWLLAASIAFFAGYFADALRPSTLASRPTLVDQVSRDAYLPASWDTIPEERGTPATGGLEPSSTP